MAKAIDLTGKKYGKLSIVDRAGSNKDGRALWNCVCDCGNTLVAIGKNITNGNTRSCGCIRSESARKRLNDITGKRFYMLTVLNLAKTNKNGTLWRCVCDCGNFHLAYTSNLISGHTKSCGCLKVEYGKSKLIDLTGQVFGLLTVIDRVDKNKNINDENVYWNCLCECGNKTRVSGMSLKRGTSQSCGCYAKKLRTIHGMSDTRINRIWRHMINRCTNKNNDGYHNYGGRKINPITVCDEWRYSFIAFYNWAMANGYADNLSIDRIDNDKGYCPENCRWTTKAIQNRNKRPESNTGINGVNYELKRNKYRVEISANGICIYIG